MKLLSFLIMLPVLAACSSNVATAKPCVHYIECPEGMNTCLSEARNICPKGYTNFDEADLGEGFASFAREHFAGAKKGVTHITITCEEE